MNDATLDAIEKLRASTPAPLSDRTIDRRAVVTKLLSKLLKLRKLGYQYSDIAEWMAGEGCDISPNTLRQYLSAARRELARVNKAVPSRTKPAVTGNASPRQTPTTPDPPFRLPKLVDVADL